MSQGDSNRAGLVGRMDRALYPQFGQNWDDHLFREMILAELSGSSDVLDLGAGAGIVGPMGFRGAAARVCGIDPDPRVVDNPHLDEGRVAYAEEIPYPDQSFDVVFCDNVLEHLEHPECVFSEVFRVLRPGGVFLGKTPNKWHYMPTIARLTPLALHKRFNAARGRDAEDTFPTRYRANSTRQIQRLAQRSGLVVDWVRLIEGRPEYLRFSVPTYLAGFLYERLVNGIPGLGRFRILLVAKLSRPRSEPDAGPG